MDVKVQSTRVEKSNRSKVRFKKRARTADSRHGRQNLGQVIYEQKNVLQHMHTEARGDKNWLKQLKQDEIIKLNTKKPLQTTDHKFSKTQQFFATQKNMLIPKSASNLLIQGDQIETVASKE